jgi:signal transduction histidine kinase
MRKNRFRSIFSRMMFMQCMTVAVAELLIGIVLAVIVYAGRIGEYGTQLNRYAQNARSVIASGAADTEAHLKYLAADNGVLIERIGAHDDVTAYYGDKRWDAYAAMPLADTQYSSIQSIADPVGGTTRGYFQRKEFPVLTAYCTVGNDIGSGLLLVCGDMTPLRASLGNMILWTVLIAAFALIGTGVVSYYTAYRVINPFIEMNHAVLCYSRGDFSTRIPVEGKDEAAQLGKSLNEMAEQLRGLEDTRRSFVANVSHELRSPLTSMKGFLEAMQDGTIPPENYPEYIEIVLNETRRMVTLVNDLLDLARIESGTIQLNFEVFDINELIRRTLLTFEARLLENEMEMEVRFAQEQCTVYADPTQIGQVLRNLIDNAIKYSPKGRSLFVSTYSMRKTVYVTVRDTGIGIPQEDVPHVFDRFYKVEKAHTPAPQMGSGLGLSIVKRIIESHGQSITVRSARNRGTQFTFTLERASASKRVTDGGKRNVS